MNVRVCDMHSSTTTLYKPSRSPSSSSSSSSSSFPYQLLHPRLTSFRSRSSYKNNNPNFRFRAKCSLVSVVEAPAQTPTESVSRRLILLRHAKSSWENRSLRDHDRPLSKSGRVDAEKISQKLQQLGWIPELILCSDAARSKETLKIMQEQVQELLEAEVHFVSSFYSVAAMDGQTAEHLQKVICRYSRDEMLTVMCMGHNRGWEEAASMFSGASIELKTCNAALLEAAGKSWDEAFAAAGFGGWKLQGIVKPSS